MNTSFIPTTNKLITRAAIITVCVLLFSVQAWARIFTSVSPGGNWSSSATWSVSSGQPGIPGTTDDVVILSGHVVNITDPGVIKSLKVTGSLNINIPGGMLLTDEIIANNGSTTGVINVTSGDLRVEKLFNLTNLQVTIDGTSSSVTYGEDKDFIRTNEYFRLNNGGKLIMENIGKGGGSIKRQYNQGDILFPIGTTDGTTYSYTPILINNRDNRPASILANVAVTVTDGVFSYGTDGPKLTSNAVNIFESGR